MNKSTLIFILLSSLSIPVFATTYIDTSILEKEIILDTHTGKIYGTLTTPSSFTSGPVALIIAGSGPTDRNCNNPAMKNDAYKKLAYALAQNQIASVRYDKRGIAQSGPAAKSELDLRFGDYVNDAEDWIQLLKEDKRFSKVIVIGHSEGSLIGMIASSNADMYISIAGAGQSADKIIKTQLSTQPQQVQDMAYPILDSLARGKTVENVNPMLAALFRPSVQPYMISWFAYDPQIEIRKLNIPVLLIQGTSDLQVTVEDAERMAAANSQAHLILVDKMNHIFRIVGESKSANIDSYNNPSLPISDELVNSITNFITQ